MFSFLCKSYVSWNLAGVLMILKQCHVFWSNYYEFLKFQKGESIGDSVLLSPLLSSGVPYHLHLETPLVLFN